MARQTKRSERRARLNKRLAAYSAAAAATAIGAPAGATPQVFPIDLMAPLNTPIFIDMDDGVADTTFLAGATQMGTGGTHFVLSGGAINGSVYGVQGSVAATTSTGNYGFIVAHRLAYSANIGPTGYNFENGGYLSINLLGVAPLWSPGDTGYLGLTFPIGPAAHFGWAELTIHPDQSMTLHRIAYDDEPRAAIGAGHVDEIPEPAHLGLLALGAAGVAALRRRRAAAIDSATADY